MVDKTKNSPHEVVTASDQVKHNYYGRPMMKGSHWRWLVINYFFLAALTGTSAAIATLAEFFGKDRTLSRYARYFSLATVIPAPILLAYDLGRPDRAFYMFRILKLRSAMSLGSWALLLHGLSAGLIACLQLLADVTKRDTLGGLRRFLGVASMPISMFVSGYTGVLLATTNVPLWARPYLLMGPTFLTSAFSSSLSALSLLLGVLGKERPRTARSLARAETVCLVAELGLLVAGILKLGKLGKPLTAGRHGRIFWPVTFVGGVVVPLLLHLSGARDEHPTPRRRAVASVLVLIGGYALRALMIFAGKESADVPEYYMEYTRSPANGRNGQP
jgi:formate-dependent nitrite reductase membrane component NrfD